MNAHNTEADRRAAYGRRIEIAKARLAQDMRRVAQELVPGGKVHGQTYSALPVHRDSDNHTAFGIYVGGPKAGGWKDFVSGETGNALQLVQLVKGCDFKTALAWAEDRFGLSHMTDEQRAATAQQIEKRQAVVDAQEAERRAKRIRQACHMFSQAEAEIEGTLVDRYLLSRGIDLRALPYRETRWLRFLPRATYWMGEARPTMPAMIAGMVNGDGLMQACHLTFLRPDGRGKADVDKPKLMWPEVKGLVIRLNMGASGLDPEAAAFAGISSPCLFGEGNEDGLSLAMGDPGQRVWAAASLSNLANVPDHPCISSYVVARDNDWGKPQAAAAFEKGLAHLRTTRKPVVEISSTEGKDFNDQLKGSSI